MAIPIRYQELFNLSTLGLSPDSFVFANCTLQSDKFICVRDQSGQQAQVVIIDNSNPASPTKFPITADSAIMNPTQKILALKAGQQLQIFHIEEKRKVKDHVLNEPVSFWKWISSNTIAMVTDTAVYHWSLEGSYPPAKVFDRLPGLRDHQIINYMADSTQKWLLLSGITQRDGAVVGNMQLFSVDRNLSQPIEGHTGAFTKVTLKGSDTPSTLFSFANKTAAGAKLFVLEIGAEQSRFEKKIVDFFFPREAVNDFPVAMQTSERYNMIFMITKQGYLYLFDLQSGKTVYMNRITAHTIFATARHEATNGLMGINTAGQVLSISVDENNIVPYVCRQLNDIPLAIEIASKNNLPGADELFVRQFQNLFSQGNYQGAASVAAESPKGLLRTTQTIQRFKTAPAVPGQPSPLFQYFSVLLEIGPLNNIESLELARPVLQQGRKELLDKWLQEDKIGCSEELGDLVRQVDVILALKVYYKAEVKNKVIACFAETGQYDKIIVYAQKVGYQPDWIFLLQNIINANPPGALKFATMLVTAPDGPLVDVNAVVDAFMQRSMIEEINSLLLDVIGKESKEEHAALQTRLLEINLVNGYAKVAAAILANDMLKHYDRAYIAKLLERAGLYQKALEHYTETADIKRVMLNTHSISPEFLVGYFLNLSPEDTLDCLRELLSANKAQNLQTCVSVAVKYSDALTPTALIQLFEDFKSYDGIYYYLNQIVNFSEDPEVHYKYIEAAVKVGQLQEVERIVQESKFYDPVKVKEFLKEAKLSEQVPLIIVCDRHGFVDDLTTYLYRNNLTRYIEVYLQKVNASQTPTVVASLLDADCNEDYIQQLLKMVGNGCPVAELVEQVEKRNRLKLILPWLEARVAEGNTEPATHNAMAYIYVDLNRDPEKFLVENPYYDSVAVGKYCESRDPHLAIVAYKRGMCDDELIACTNHNGLFRAQARYLVERQDQELWGKVLVEESPHRRQLIDQIVQTALPDSKNPDEVSSTVKAFMTADLPTELIELLEKIVLENSLFSGNRNLQNLLILTAIKAAPERVMDYINRLDNYDATDIANIAVTASLHEEAFTIYKKFQHHGQAIQVLINHIGDLDRAFDFADAVDHPEVFSKLAKAQLDRGEVKKAIDAFIRASNNEYYRDVIEVAERQEKFDDLVRFLQMCRAKGGKDPIIETELIYSFAKTENLRDLDEFINKPNCAHIQNVGDRCYNEGLYQAAKLLFNNISNYARLATTLVKLEEFSAGVDAAAKAGNVRTWKEVCYACVDAEQFRLAQICGLHIIVRPDELEELIHYYESRGHFEELLGLLENGLISERAHQGVFTELAILYSKYKPDKLMEHLKIFHSRLNMLKVLRVCEKNHQWNELTFLYVHYKEFDNAATTMIEHSVEAWEHALFKEIIPKVASAEVLYKAIQFYLEEHPLSVNDLLSALIARVDHSRVISLVRSLGHLAVIKPYLLSVQAENILAVNNAVNELLVEEEDHINLRKSIDSFNNIETMELANRLEKHELVEFRRIAAYLFKLNKKWRKSIELSQEDKLWKDAIDTAASSKDPKLVKDLLTFFVENDRKDCFAACLYTCFDLVQPDVALELAWKNGMTDFAMPFMIQTMRNMSDTISQLKAAVFPPEQQQMGQQAQQGVQQGFVDPQQQQMMMQQQQQQQQQQMAGSFGFVQQGGSFNGAPNTGFGSF
eukprot:CAMPEP_0114634276 /NCGR_PEP_ID=MMETSP0168-20121206/15897_1 /TAXON_ID=95228 ORGANISM="Vannella sp., Strain DIVA3 517/6/12" /NCGR_SAMPLE_ID=MMETSP0168 /ASSEMBLY_ACC=CAM_ASM_000044 /LENGTH=1681 /DNA_ID=CAMNT_0001845973 /DNA_START=191 /DNA_END=5236 /DNA_ORIENTATION=+